jgi:hypothetical protein
MSIVTYNNRSIRNISSVPGAAKSLTHIKTLTASSSATLSFVNGSDDVVLDSTYPIYLFKYINCHPATDEASFTVGFRDGSTDYDATKTTTNFRAYQNEGGSAQSLGYSSSIDIAQGTGFQTINYGVDNDADSACSGEMFLFNPSSTTFVKHFLQRGNTVQEASITRADHTAGYCNVPAAIDAVQFKFSSGNIDAGTIKLYGIKDS